MASVRKRGDAFLITAYLGYDEQGKQVKKTTTYHPPGDVTAGKAKKLAEEYAVIWEDKVKGYTNLNENRTFSELVSWYYENVAPSTLKENVMIDNRSIINTYVLPSLARKKLKEISPVMLDTLFRELQVRGRVKDTYALKDGVTLPKGGRNGNSRSDIARETGISRTTINRLVSGKGVERDNAEKIAAYLEVNFNDMFISDVEDRALGVSSVSRIKRCLSAIFTAAVKKEIMRRNPCSNTVSLKRPRSASSFLDEQQALTLITALEEKDDFQFKTMINTLLFTGMRGGELCGLQWQDVDFDNGIIYIRQTLTYLRGKGKGKKAVYVLNSTKTTAGERYIVIPASLLGLLKEHKKKQDNRRAAFGSDWIDYGMVFTAPFGNYHSSQYLNTKFKKLALKIGLPEDVHIHSLRHTTASLLINSDVSPKAIAEQLGHASTSITQDIYSHIFQSSKARTAQALDLKLNPNGVQQ